LQSSSSDEESSEEVEEGVGEGRGVTEHGEASGSGAMGEGGEQQSRGRKRRAEQSAEHLRHNQVGAWHLD